MQATAAIGRGGGTAVGGARAWRMWGLAVAFYVVAIFHRMALGVAGVEAADRLHASAGLLTALAALQLGLYLAMQIPSGLLADRLGPRRALALGLALMAAGETLFALATGAAPALAGRGLVGIGDACIFLNVLRIAHAWFPRRRYALLASLTAVGGAAGQLVATVPLRLALDGPGWTATFLAGSALTALLALVSLAAIHDEPGRRSVARVRREPLLVELRAGIAHRGTRIGFWTHFALMAPFVSLTGLWAAPYLEHAQGVSAGTVSLLLAGAVLAFALAAPLSGWLGGGRPRRRLAIAALTAAAIGAALTAVLAWPAGTPPLALLAALLALTGVGGAASMLAFDLARDGAPAAGAGAISGLVNSGGFTAAATADAAVGVLLALLAGQPAPEAYRIALLPLLALVALGLAGLARASRPVAAPGRPRGRGPVRSRA